MEIEFYETANGKCPILEFLNSLRKTSVKLEAKAARSIQLLEEFGTGLREPNSKPLGDGIFELRVSAQKNEARILYFFFHEGKVVLTHGFVKKTQKTPPGEIERAKRIRLDYLSR